MKKAYIIGKGPSLDNLQSMDITPGSWVYCLNESIFKVLDLRIDSHSHVLMCQMDYELGETCRPYDERASIFLSERCREQKLYETYNKRFFWTTKDPSAITAVMAIEIAKFYIEPSEIIMCCFDALTNGNCEYAKCIGYPSSRPHLSNPESTLFRPDRFLAQRTAIYEALCPTKTTWFTPEKR